ncbi:MAG: hypothetical protein ACR2GL_03585 [Thermoleophilaceae bacterium]
MKRAQVKREGFDPNLELPYALKPEVFSIAMDDIYEMLATANEALIERGLLRLEESVRGAIYSGLLSDLMAEAIANHAGGLTKNEYPNGHPDLLPVGRYPDDSAQTAEEGLEVKITGKPGGAVDMHGNRTAWYCVSRYEVDLDTQPVVGRAPTRFTHIWVARLQPKDFRKNERGPLGTRTATPHKEGLKVLRAGLLYKDD